MHFSDAHGRCVNISRERTLGSKRRQPGKGVACHGSDNNGASTPRLLNCPFIHFNYLGFSLIVCKTNILCYPTFKKILPGEHILSQEAGNS